MKKLALLLLLPSCLQQGLVADPNAITNATTSTGGTSFGLTPQIELTKKNGEFSKTVFGNKDYDGHTIQGYGKGLQGETFCFSNENNSTTHCKKPLYSSNLSSEEDDLLDVLQNSDPPRDNTNGLGLILHAVQFYFSNTPTAFKPADDNLYYSTISNLKISLKTAPISFDKDTGVFSWDYTKEKTMNYLGSCSLSDDNAVGFDLISNATLSTKKSERAKYFVTGLWVFERSPTKPYEDGNNVNPIGPYEGSSDGPSQLFSTRTSIYASLLIPGYDADDSDKLGFQYFPGNESSPEDSPSVSPKPFKYTIGLYRQNSFHASTVSLSNEITMDTTSNGAIRTPVMGKYYTDELEFTSTHPDSQDVEWQKRVITGLCISGLRKTYNGSATSTTNSPIWTHPVVHALSYELRKIKVTLK